MRELFNKICVVCGVEFKCKTEKRKHCSTKCYRVFRPCNRTYHILSCEWCGNDFKHINHKTRFCSISCCSKFKNKNRAKIEKVCVVCGNNFELRVGDRSDACSKKCRNKLYDNTKRDKVKAK